MFFGKKAKWGLKKDKPAFADSSKERKRPEPEEEIRGNSVGNINTGGRVARQGDWIYHQSDDGGKIYKIKTDGSGRQKINDDKSLYINVVGDWIYYSNEDNGGELYKIKTDGSGRQKINDDKSWDINVVGDWIYYNNRRNRSEFYKIKTDGSGREKINDDKSLFNNVVGDWIYYSNEDDGGELYKIKTDGSGRQKINGDKSWYINVIGDWIYYRNEADGGKIYKIKTDGSGREKINDDKSWDINVVGDWIYYRNEADGGKIYKIKTDGSGREKINDDKSWNNNVVGDWIYYKNDADGGKLYKIKTDGSGRQVVEPAAQEKDTSKLDVLIAQLKDREMDRRRAAAEELGKTGDVKAVAPLIKALKDATDYPVSQNLLQYSCVPEDARVEAALALGKIGDKSAVEALQEMSNVNTSKGYYRGLTVSEAADKALSELGHPMKIGHSDETLKLCKKLLSNDYGIRNEAIAQASLIVKSVEDASFQRTFQASEKLKSAFDKQALAYSSTEPMEACHEAISLEPGFSAAYVCLSYLYRQYAKEYDNALKWSKKALEVDANNMHAWSELGMVYVALNNVVEAARAFHKVASAEPQFTNIEPVARLVSIYRRLGMQEFLGKAMLRLSQAGLGLDPDLEREWDRLVAETDLEELREAVAVT